MKKTLTLILLLIAAMSATAQEKKIKVVSTDDLWGDKTFEQVLGPNKYEIDSIVIEGDLKYIKAEVFDVLRDCCTKGRLTGIDMSRCISLKDHEIPPMAFYPELMNGKPRKKAGDDSGAGYRTNLRYITLPRRITKIGDYAFANTNIVAIGIPCMLNEIGNNAFAGCEHLKDVTLYGDRGQMEANGSQFNGLPGDAVLHVAPGTADRYRNSEGWAAFAKVDETEDAYRVMDIAVDENRRLEDALAGYNMQVDSIKLSGTPTVEDFDMLRNNCRYGRLYSIDLTDCDVTTTGKGRLEITWLAYLRMPKTMPVIFDMFLSRSKVENLIMPESYEEIGYTAFRAYEGFADSTLLIPEGCRKIDYMAFVNCHSLNAIMLPSTLDELEPASLGFTWAAEWLSPQIDIYVNRMIPPVCLDTFDGSFVTEDGPFGCDRVLKGDYVWCLTRSWRLFVPVGAKKNYENAVHWDHFKTIIETPLLTGTPTGIAGTTITTPQSDVKEVYTTDGRLVAKGTTLPRLGKGLYIVKTGSGTKKVMVK